MTGIDIGRSQAEGRAMSMQQSRNVSLNAELNAYINARVAAGDYNSASELIRAAVRLLRKREPVARPAQAH